MEDRGIHTDHTQQQSRYEFDIGDEQQSRGHEQYCQIHREQDAARGCKRTETPAHPMRVGEQSNTNRHQHQHIDEQRQSLAGETTAARVLLAKSEQQLEGLRAQKAQFEDDRRERDRALAALSDHLATCLERYRQSERTILDATSELALLYAAEEEVDWKKLYEKEKMENDRLRKELEKKSLEYEEQSKVSLLGHLISLYHYLVGVVLE